jgi:hypothetical protein
MDCRDSGSDLTHGASYVAYHEVDAGLRDIARGDASRSSVWPLLVRSKIYVVDGDLCLEEDGPRLELPLRQRGRELVLHVYTSRASLPPGTREMEITSLLFSVVAQALPLGIGIVVDEGSEAELVISPLEVVRLKATAQREAA